MLNGQHLFLNIKLVGNTTGSDTLIEYVTRQGIEKGRYRRRERWQPIYYLTIEQMVLSRTIYKRRIRMSSSQQRERTILSVKC